MEQIGTSSAWEAEVLPLNNTRKMLGFRRFYSPTIEAMAGVIAELHEEALQTPEIAQE